MPPLCKFVMAMLALYAPLSHAFCFDEAAKEYQVDAGMLKAIAYVESRYQNGIESPPNANGSYDIGVMQINSGLLPILASKGITKEQLRGNACLNVKVGAWVLSQKIAQYGTTWRAVGAYNAHDETKRAVYVAKVQSAYYGRAFSASGIIYGDSRQTTGAIKRRPIYLAENND